VWRTYQELRREDGARADRFAREVGRYEQALAANGLTPEDAAGAPAGGGEADRWRRPAWLAAAAPLALAGIALNAVPYRVVDRIARRAARTPDQPATYKVLGALVVFPLAWAAQAAAAATFLGAVALAALPAAPLTGYVALVWTERLREARTRARRRRAARAPGMAAVARQRDELRGAMAAILAAHTGDGARPTAGTGPQR
jgi:hypothetical protein